MARSTVHYADNETNNILKRLHNKLRPAGTPVQRVEYIIELLLLRIFEVKLKRDPVFEILRKLFTGENEEKLFYYPTSLPGDQALKKLNQAFFPFYSKILSHARLVFQGNPPQKVLDQLVLIEEVFDNSSFTANVKGGMLHEILGLVEELNEERLLYTDLLGDAIESALSETGGTRDIGLHRTPDHIRQLMVVMIDPQFNDVIFDPACGTGGFLFDSFQYVIEKVTKDGKWPGPKAHPELQEFFKSHFSQFNEKMPTADIANAFYRNGIGGIEYLGMIRKMAAVNLFIRGLNPHNIEQGDSLKMFNPAHDAGSKSIVIANPPFGAERDQTAYPNVWEEYSKESETTILFVKLMFNLLKKGGRCAVIVSEGFLTWDQNSAKALRKTILDEANLKAIISLPQGVFVSKSGQGAKTSILYFEKGEPTKSVWFYKIENDGYSMGVNRKPINGSQIPEIIELFSKYVMKGMLPPETKYSFAIPAEWIKTLDPRIKERIRKETRGILTLRAEKKREELVQKLDERLAKRKIDEETKHQKLWEFDTNLENKIQNEISKSIDKAHTYSLNLTNYRSSLREEQIQEWNLICHGEKPKETLKLLDKQYEELQITDSEKAQRIICTLDPKNALEMDIAREHLIKHRDGNDMLKRLEEIFKKGFSYPRVTLEKLLIPKYERIKKEEYRGDLKLVEKITFEDGLIHFRDTRETGMDLYQAAKGDLVTSKINIHQGASALAPIDLACSTHYQIYEINGNEVHPDFLVEMLRSKQFLTLLAEEKNKGIKNEQGPAFLLKFQIPLPPLEEQQEISNDIDRYKQIIESTNRIVENYKPVLSFEKNVKQVEIGKACEIAYGDALPESERNKGEYPVVGAGAIIGYHDSYIVEGPTIVIGRRGATSGGVLWIEKSCFPIDTAFFVSTYDSKRIDKKYLYYALKNANLMSLQSGGAMPGVNREHVYRTKIPLPTLEEQKILVEKLNKESNVIEGLIELKVSTQQRISELLEKIWSEGD